LGSAIASLSSAIMKRPTAPNLDGEPRTLGACANCGSKTVPACKRGVCRKCSYWCAKLKILERTVSSAEGTHDSISRNNQTEIRRVRRVLAEYAWREAHRSAPDVHPLAVESMVYAIARECRSEVGFPICSDLADLSPRARKTIFEILLAIVENIPSKSPRLHTLTPPERGHYHFPWLDWA
jgi:hypothetical protein